MTHRSIVIMRHGEAEPSANYSADHSRKLTVMGCKQVMNTSEKLNKQGFTADLLITSDAARAKKSLEIYIETVGATAKIIYDGQFYETTSSIFFDYLCQLDDAIQHVIFFGHNPTWSQLVSGMTRTVTSLNTADAALMETDLTHWKDVPSSTWKLRDHIQPF